MLAHDIFASRPFFTVLTIEQPTHTQRGVLAMVKRSGESPDLIRDDDPSAPGRQYRTVQVAGLKYYSSMCEERTEAKGQAQRPTEKKEKESIAKGVGRQIFSLFFGRAFARRQAPSVVPQFFLSFSFNYQ